MIVKSGNNEGRVIKKFITRKISSRLPSSRPFPSERRKVVCRYSLHVPYLRHFRQFPAVCGFEISFSLPLVPRQLHRNWKIIVMGSLTFLLKIAAERNSANEHISLNALHLRSSAHGILKLEAAGRPRCSSARFICCVNDEQPRL